jgi:hypothetical protein
VIGANDAVVSRLVEHRRDRNRIGYLHERRAAPKLHQSPFCSLPWVREPIVDHKRERAEALRRYGAVT